VCVPDGENTVVLKAESGTFELGPTPWDFISGTGGTSTPVAGTIAGSGVAATSTEMVQVSSATPGCVIVCCPFSPGGNGCTTTDPTFGTAFTSYLTNCP
jgi:hypothetical protein